MVIRKVKKLNNYVPNYLEYDNYSKIFVMTPRVESMTMNNRINVEKSNDSTHLKVATFGMID